MGITIHYTLITEDYETVLFSINTAREYAKKNGYKVKEESTDVYISYSMFIVPMEYEKPEDRKRYLETRWKGYREEVLFEIPEEPPWPWIVENYPETGSLTCAIPWWSYSEIGEKPRKSKLEGVYIYIDTAEPFEMTFYKIGRYYICDGFTKTQAFTVDEVEPNTLFHKWICNLLRYLEKNGRWWHFYVLDEAGYYDTMDESRIAQSFEYLGLMIYGLASRLAEEFDGEVEVGGRVKIREKVEKLKEVYSEDIEEKDVEEKPRKKQYQSRLDEFYNEKIE